MRKFLSILLIAICLTFTGCGEPKIIDAPQYLSYSSNLHGLLYDDDQIYVLFFHDSSDAFSLALSNEMKEGIEDFSVAVKILEVDFETEVQLKAAYKITKPGTILTYDEDGRVKEKLEKPTLEEVKSAI